MSAREEWGGARLLRGVLRAYDPAEHVAAVEPVGASMALLAGLPVLSCVAPSEMVLGRAVSMMLWPDVGGVVLGPALAPYASMRLWDAGCVTTASNSSSGQRMISRIDGIADSGLPKKSTFRGASIHMTPTSQPAG